MSARFLAHRRAGAARRARGGILVLIGVYLSVAGCNVTRGVTDTPSGMYQTPKKGRAT